MNAPKASHGSFYLSLFNVNILDTDNCCRRTAKNLVACRYEVDDNWYRARVIDFNTQNLTVRYLDFGNVEIVPFTYIQSLESTHTSLPWQVRMDQEYWLIYIAGHGLGYQSGYGYHTQKWVQ